MNTEVIKRIRLDGVRSKFSNRQQQELYSICHQWIWSASSQINQQTEYQCKYMGNPNAFSVADRECAVSVTSRSNPDRIFLEGGKTLF